MNDILNMKTLRKYDLEFGLDQTSKEEKIWYFSRTKQSLASVPASERLSLSSLFDPKRKIGVHSLGAILTCTFDLSFPIFVLFMIGICILQIKALFKNSITFNQLLEAFKFK